MLFTVRSTPATSTKILTSHHCILIAVVTMLSFRATYRKVGLIFWTHRQNIPVNVRKKTICQQNYRLVGNFGPKSKETYVPHDQSMFIMTMVLQQWEQRRMHHNSTNIFQYSQTVLASILQSSVRTGECVKTRSETRFF